MQHSYICGVRVLYNYIIESGSNFLEPDETHYSPMIQLLSTAYVHKVIYKHLCYSVSIPNYFFDSMCGSMQRIREALG